MSEMSEKDMVKLLVSYQLLLIVLRKLHFLDWTWDMVFMPTAFFAGAYLSVIVALFLVGLFERR